MRLGSMALAIATIGVSLTAPATAATISFSGQGTADTLQGQLPRNAPASIGATFRFSFTFDTAAITFLEGDDQNAFYDLPVTNFAATIGDYDFALSAEQGFEPAVAIGRGFTSFGQPFSEPTLITTFYFASARTTASSTDTPFATGAGAYGALAINAFFRAGDGEAGLGIDELRDPSSADRLTFSYTTRDPITRRSGTILGAYRGGFATAAAVPEPATWGLMLIGFALVGASLRYRRLRTAVTYA